jgi:prepilin-type N-terminal cleavage/methylation domain-containing protein
MCKFNSKMGFTLIELMVVIVIIGVLASLAIPRFTEASDKAKMAEAPRIIASYEGAYLAGVAEKGEVTAFSDLIFAIPTSKWFTYTVEEESPEKMRATANNNIGKFVADSEIGTDYDATGTPASGSGESATEAVAASNEFTRCAYDWANVSKKMIPNFDSGTNGLGECN